MTYDPNDPNRVPGADPYISQPRVGDSDAMSWGVPAAFAVLTLIIGALFMFSYAGEERTTTASNNPPAATRTVPAPAPVLPAPPVTAPKQ